MPQKLPVDVKALLSDRLKVEHTQKDITFGDLPSYWLRSAPGKDQPKPWSRVLGFQSRRAALKAARSHWPHEPVVHVTGHPYAARDKILKWFSDKEEERALAGDPVAVVQQLP